MADITMCKGENCKMRDSCRRYLAIPDKWQSYGAFEELKKGNYCDWYWRWDNEFEDNRPETTKTVR